MYGLERDRFEFEKDPFLYSDMEADETGVFQGGVVGACVCMCVWAHMSTPTQHAHTCWPARLSSSTLSLC